MVESTKLCKCIGGDPSEMEFWSTAHASYLFPFHNVPASGVLLMQGVSFVIRTNWASRTRCCLGAAPSYFGAVKL